MRAHVDTPTRAAFIEPRSKLEVSLLTDQAAEHLRDRGVTEIHCLGPEGGYVVWRCAD